MKSKLLKSLSLILCGALLSSISIGAVVYGAGSDKIKDSEGSIRTAVSPSEKEKELVKEETVYVLAGADGSVQKIIVSDWIKNSSGSGTIRDKSELTDIENVKGNETYTMDGSSMRVWDAQGKDIYYQGNIEKEVPVSMAVTYKLDGKTISAEELAGKSGKVTIRFEYVNHQYEVVSIDGKNEKIYVPFAMLTGMLLDNDIFTNVEVSNGKLVNDGSRIAVIGLSFPGWQESLNINKDKCDIPDYIEIKADVKNFEMANTVTIATNAVFNNISTDKLNSLEDLINGAGDLTEAMGQLMDGSSQLYEGLCTLLDRSGELIRGIDQLADGAVRLRAGAEEANNGAAELYAGTRQLADGLGQLAANNNTLNAGARQVFESLLNMADSQLSAAGLTVPPLTIENYAVVLNEVMVSLDEKNVAAQAQAAARASVTQAVNAQKETIKEAVTTAVRREIEVKAAEAVRQNVETQVLAAMGMTKEQYEAAVQAGMISNEQQQQVKAAIDNGMESDGVKAGIEAAVRKQMGTEEIQDLITAKTEEQITARIEQNMNSPQVQEQITAALEKAKSGAAAISALKEQLDSYAVFYRGLNEYTVGVASAKTGAEALTRGSKQLEAGTAELSAGMDELYNGILTLRNGAPALTEGVVQLRNGSMKLSEGLKEFNEKGIRKLTEAVEGNISGLITRVKAMADVSKDYQSFAGMADSMQGQVKFIYRTEAIGK